MSIDKTGYSATIHTWETIIGKTDDPSGDSDSNVGHSSVTLSSDSESEYLSFRPKAAYLVNPFTTFLFPVTGKMFDYDEDKSHENRPPDRNITINLNKEQYHSMMEEVQKQKEETNNGTKLYQLFCNFSPLLWTVKAMSSKTGYSAMTTCPFTGQSICGNRYKDLTGIQKVSPSHCSNSVKSVLESGGISTPKTRIAPWDTTPTQLGDYMDKLYKE